MIDVMVNRMEDLPPEDGGFEEWEHVSVLSEAETSAIIEMAALVLDDNPEASFDRAMDLPLAILPTTLTVAAMMVSSLAEMVAMHENRSAEQVLLELRLWYDDIEPEGEI